MFFPDDDNRDAAMSGDMPTAPLQNRSMDRRNLLVGIGALGIAGSFGANKVLAQESTPTAAEVDKTDAEDSGDEEINNTPQIGEKYLDFVAKLAANLGETDATVVDTAIRDALKAMVDDEFDAGDISRNAATAIKERIDSSDAPIAVMMIGGMGRRMRDRRSRRRDETEDSRENGESEPSDTSILPTTEPTVTP